MNQKETWSKAKDWKNKFINKFFESEKQFYSWCSRDIDKIDVILLIITLGMLFLLFSQGDISITGNRSFLMYHHLRDFYDASYELTGGYGANYLPSTFWVFAIWNLPLYVLGFFPDSVEAYSLANFWYQILPAIIFFLSSYLLRKIAVNLGIDNCKSRVCQFVFLMSPIAVYSQFVFSQYDIFTVFFMLLGLYYYFKSKKYQFILCFGIAITFKYYALIYFLVLLILIEKRISRILISTFASLLPAFLEIVLYVNSYSFRKSVFDFSALSTIKAAFPWTSTGNISIMLLVILMLLILAYTQSYTIKWSICLLNGVNLAFFGCNYWNPQWLLISIPFMVLGIMYSRKGEILLIVELVFSIALWMRIGKTYGGELDILLLKGGVLRNVFIDRAFVSMPADIYSFIDSNYINTVFLGAYIVFFILTLPQFQVEKEENSFAHQNLLLYIRSTFWVGILCFLLPMIPGIKGSLEGKDYFLNIIDGSTLVEVIQGDEIRQTIIADGYRIEEIEILIGTYARSNESYLQIELIDAAENVIYSGQKSCRDMKDNTWVRIVDESIQVEKDMEYTLRITTDAEVGQNIALYLSDKNEKTNGYTEIYKNGSWINDKMVCTRVVGKKYIK